MSSRRNRMTRSEQNASLIRALRGEDNFVLEEDCVELGGKETDDTTAETRRTEKEEANEDKLIVSSVDIDDIPVSIASIDDIMERAKYIPLRLSYEERKSLRLVNAAINMSDYTNAVDIDFKNKSKRRHVQLQQICGFLSGVISAANYDEGQRVLDDRNFAEYESFLQDTLEISRRYKVMNPEKMRSEYGKLVLLMQDATTPEIKALLGADIYRPIKTVYTLLQSKHGLRVLQDPRLKVASMEVFPDKHKSRATIQSEIQRKEKAAKAIVRDHAARGRLSEDDIRLCLYSICDNNSFLNSNRRPIDDCIDLLQLYFHPHSVSADYSLAIDEGRAGARLSHSHDLQYSYVLQSLTLWSAIVQDLFRLWYLAEDDLLACAEQPYELRETGQGLQRVQQSPKVYRAMHELLAHTQEKLGGWVGSSVIHLGDSNVPNTLVFIDKYTQVSRILGPLVLTLNNLEKACEENAGLSRYIRSYGGLDAAKKDILLDFFTHAFDGSGGTNFFEAGSCIDGRLTSAWNWCSQLASKPYYVLFRLTGFLSFDGEFDK